MKKRTLYIILTFILIISSLVNVTYAWFNNFKEINISDIQGSIVTNYFNSGDGSEENPFTITKPRHLFNLSQLYQRLEDFDKQNYHFKVEADIDMSDYEGISPIGTADKPFNATFDGEGHVIDQLTISGDGRCDIGIFGYVGEDANISNAYFNNLTIDVNDCLNDDGTLENHTAHNDTAYVGYIAGHVETASSFSNVYVNNCKITGKPTLAGLNNNLGYYGYCEDAMSIEEIVARVKGVDIGWGGSVDMEAMYNRLYSIAGSATNNRNYVYDKTVTTKVNGNIETTNTLTGQAYTYYSEKVGSFVFSSARGNYMYLHGGTTITPVTESYGNSYTGYTISSGTHYLSTDGDSLIDTNAEDATVWQVSGNTIYTIINGTRHYLHYSSSGWITTTYTLDVSTTSSNWTITNNGNSSQIYYRRNNNNTYYIKYNSNAWRMATGSANIAMAQTTGHEIISTSGTTYVDYENGTNTYFPLITNDDNTAADINTGYVVSGSNDRTTSGTYPAKSGDIRVSKYSTSDISNSYSNGSLTSVYTIDTNGSRQTVTSNDFEKYSKSAGELLEMISSGNIYGLHFMSGLIDESNIVTANYALINGVEKNNYQLPANSIDFNLIEKGYINFFAGTYFSNNNSFFSLHHIERDEDTDEITSIKEITNIYSDGVRSHDYIYKYSDNTYSDTLTGDYNLIFSTSQIKKQNSLTSNALYYFEIPVNAGEFALGSVDGGTGAYLMYLDIGTNGGTDDLKTVDNFGSVEYRTTPNTTEKSILLISYVYDANVDIDLTVSYVESEKKYYVNIVTSRISNFKIALLDSNYTVVVNNNTIINTVGMEVITC